LASVAGKRLRGTMLWFNVEKDIGALLTADGLRVEIPGTAFAPGEKPSRRCAGMVIEFEALGDTEVAGISFVPEQEQRRARMRNRR
jgi:hypothetical protein